MRGRSYSYSPSPSPRGYGRRYRSPSPRGRYSRGKELPTSLLVRNLRQDCRPEDLRGPFGRFGPIKDIYLPRDYYTGNLPYSIAAMWFAKYLETVTLCDKNSVLFLEKCQRLKTPSYESFLKISSSESLLGFSSEPRGFGFVQFMDPADAADAKYDMNGYVLFGRELTVVFAEENRKKPSEMRARDRTRSRSYDRRRSPLGYSRSPRYRRTYSRSPDYSPRRHYSRSISPRDRSYRDRSYSRSPYRSPYGSRSRSPYSSGSRTPRSVTPGYSR